MKNYILLGFNNEGYVDFTSYFDNSNIHRACDFFRVKGSKYKLFEFNPDNHSLKEIEISVTVSIVEKNNDKNTTSGDN